MLGQQPSPKNRFVSTLTHMVSILPEGKPLWERPYWKVDILEVLTRRKGSDSSPEGTDAWKNEIGKAGIGGAFRFSDGSMLESGNVKLSL